MAVSFGSKVGKVKSVSTGKIELKTIIGEFMDEVVQGDILATVTNQNPVSKASAKEFARAEIGRVLSAQNWALKLTEKGYDGSMAVQIVKSVMDTFTTVLVKKALETDQVSEACDSAVEAFFDSF